MEYLGFYEESDGIGPVTGRDREGAAMFSEIVRLNSCERTWSRDAGSSGIAKFVPLACVQGRRADGGLPFSVGRARTLPVAKNISLIGDFKGLHCAPNIHVRCGTDGIPHHDIGYDHVRPIGLGTGFPWQGHQVSDVQLVPGYFTQVERLIFGMLKPQLNRLTDPCASRQADAEKS